MSDEETYQGEGEQEEEEGGQGLEEEQVEEEQDPDKPLTEGTTGECLSLLCKTGDGLSHCYTKLDARDRELTDISILNGFIHLRYVDLSKNNLRDISALNSLTHLLTLKADQNKLTSARLDDLPYLQVASFNYNKIRTTEGLNHPQLEHLSLNYNEIREVEGLDPVKLSRLHTLELRGNKLETTAGINLTNLKNLFLGANSLTRLEGLERLEHLATLHLRDNQLDKCDGFSDTMANLQYLNMRGNNISDIKEVKKVQVLPKIRAVVFKDNPMSGDDDYRLEVLIALRRIERLDKDEYNDDERQEAEEIAEQRRQDELLTQEGAEELIPSDTED